MLRKEQNMRWIVVVVLALVYIAGAFIDYSFDSRLGELLKGLAMAIAIVLFFTSSLK
jgi:hypothetical protein